jgi:hypothetical protein
MSDCGFEGDLDSLLWELPSSRAVIMGAVGLLDCTFQNCKFTRIGVAGNAEFISRVRSPCSMDLVEVRGLWPADLVAAAARRAGLEVVEKLLPRTSPVRT